MKKSIYVLPFFLLTSCSSSNLSSMDNTTSDSFLTTTHSLEGETNLIEVTTDEDSFSLDSLDYTSDFVSETSEEEEYNYKEHINRATYFDDDVGYTDNCGAIELFNTSINKEENTVAFRLYFTSLFHGPCIGHSQRPKRDSFNEPQLNNAVFSLWLGSRKKEDRLPVFTEEYNLLFGFDLLSRSIKTYSYSPKGWKDFWILVFDYYMDFKIPKSLFNKERTELFYCCEAIDPETDEAGVMFTFPFVYHYEEETLVFDNNHFANRGYLVLGRDIMREDLRYSI